MKRTLLTLAFSLLASTAWAQCTGVFPANSVCGTTTSGTPHSISGLSALGTLGPGQIFNNPTASPAVAIATANPLLNGTFTIHPPAASITKALDIAQSGPASGTLAADVDFNKIAVSSDQYQLGLTNQASAFTVDYTFGGANLIGVRTAFHAHARQTAISNAGNSNINYVAGTFRIDVDASEGGTNTGAGSRGAAYGQNVVVANELATINNWGGFVGAEYDFSIAAATTVRAIVGVNVSKVNNDVRGAVVDAGFVVGANGPTHWNNGFVVSDYNGAVGVATTGTLFGLLAVGNVATPWSFANGVDIRNASFSSYVFASDKFTVSGDGTVLVLPTTGALNKALQTTQAIGGTGTSFNQANYFLIASDAAKISGASGVLVGWDFTHIFGGGDMGARQAMFVEARRTAASDPTNTLYQDVVFSASFNGQSSNNGTGPGANARGNGYGGYFASSLSNGATNWVALTGLEIDLGADSTSSAEYNIGLRIAHTSVHATKGVSYDTAMDFTDATGAVGWDALITSGNVGGQFPLASTGTFIRTIGAQTFTNGVDFSSATITGSAFKSPNFDVLGTGETQTPVLKTTTALITATNGSTTAAFTANMVGSTGGPVTTAQNGWVKMKDSSGATIWVPVWK